MTGDVMKVELILHSPPPSEIPSSESDSDQLDLGSLEISLEKLGLVLGITFAFILLLLFSLICIFYFMGFLQNVFGYSWSYPMGRTFSSPAFYFDDVSSSPVPGHHIPNTVQTHPGRCPSSHSTHRVPAMGNCVHSAYLGAVHMYDMNLKPKILPVGKQRFYGYLGLLTYETSLPRVAKKFESYVEEEMKTKMPIVNVYRALSDETNEIAFQRMEKEGIPYILILKEELLEKGLTFLRWRETTLEEEIHAKHLVTKLCLYYRARLPKGHPLKSSAINANPK